MYTLNCFDDREIQHLGEMAAVMKVFEDKRFEQLANTENATSSHLQELAQSTAEALYSPVLPRAREVAQELIGMDESGRRDLIAEVWWDALLHRTSLRGCFPLPASQHWWGVHHASPPPHVFSRPFPTTPWCLGS